MVGLGVTDEAIQALNVTLAGGAIGVAVTSALLGKDPDVEHLRLRIGQEINKRLSAAVGPDADPAVVESLELLYAGALVRAGMGYASYQQIADLLERSTRMLLD